MSDCIVIFYFRAQGFIHVYTNIRFCFKHIYLLLYFHTKYDNHLVNLCVKHKKWELENNCLCFVFMISGKYLFA